ncbi:hypothetical protein J6590_024743 [Homalodisca vitripennis]|nr:hypothetical protein J6590_024743 [Homalodisca vitripennis]
MLELTAKLLDDISDTKSLVSSAYIRGVQCLPMYCDVSFVRRIKRTGPRTEPWGTPLLIGRGSDLVVCKKPFLKSTSACVKIEDEKEFSFETVYCNENFQEVKLEAEYNEAYESTASFLFKSESRAEPAVSYNTASSESPVEIKSESSKDVTQVLDVSGSVTSSEPIENHSVITLERSHNSTSDVDLCRLRHHDLAEPSFNVEVGEKGIGAPETTETIVLKRSLPVDKPSERISPSSVTTSETLFNKPSGLPDGQDVLHVISLKKIPKNRRQAAREKITEVTTRSGISREFKGPGGKQEIFLGENFNNNFSVSKNVLKNQDVI